MRSIAVWRPRFHIHGPRWGTGAHQPRMDCCRVSAPPHLAIGRIMLHRGIPVRTMSVTLHPALRPIVLGRRGACRPPQVARVHAGRVHGRGRILILVPHAVVVTIHTCK
eukprot:991869-Prymnesium_polylepis.1